MNRSVLKVNKCIFGLAVGKRDYGSGGYSHSGLTGGPVRVKKAQGKNFENYPQMVVSFYNNPQMAVYEPENFVIW